MYASLNIAQGSFQADQAAFVAALDKAHVRSLHSYFTQYVLTDGERCADEQLQLRRFDSLGSAFEKNLAQFACRFLAEPGLLCVEFFALLAQLLERITRARFGPGHQIVLSLAVGPLHARQCQHEAM